MSGGSGMGMETRSGCGLYLLILAAALLFLAVMLL